MPVVWVCFIWPYLGSSRNAFKASSSCSFLEISSAAEGGPPQMVATTLNTNCLRGSYDMMITGAAVKYTAKIGESQLGCSASKLNVLMHVRVLCVTCFLLARLALPR